MGSKDTNVKVNELDNDITGNEGMNAVVFSGNADEYEINTSENTTNVVDTISDRDGNNLLRNVEQLQFADQTINL